jgi:hypothetical protein
LKKFLCSLLVAGFAISGFAAPQASNGRDFVTLRDTACSSAEVLAHVPDQLKKYFYNAEVFLNGTQYKACFTVQGENVILVYPDGDQGMLPVAMFKEAGV